jgi:hypothetical protein
VGHVALMGGKKKDSFRVLVRKPKEMRPHGISGNRWKDNIKIDLKYDGRMRIRFICHSIEISGFLL